MCKTSFVLFSTYLTIQMFHSKPPCRFVGATMNEKDKFHKILYSILKQMYNHNTSVTKIAVY